LEIARVGPWRETKLKKQRAEESVRRRKLYSLFMNFLLDLYGFSDVMVV
jgi:hypothetical protein